ncbi:hypothetical protein P22_0545 [Propionispora sp. 2/2-37]|uniref:polysaccharide biosynthesis/export family protein n=1 Tax=Propionispora sp. 2/2-37 TaxID=1677858 RepID=UPI0006BB62AC|nr:polysaccharide biosynthesis/export family protein [Propionispora sp. 2/2-37]CUH94479.1 hypothetical protein P22_0545 [Propionispora sp. 2/2-37]
MKALSSILSLFLFFFFAVSGLAGAQEQEYLIAPGDVLSIRVWGMDELGVEKVVVRPDGKIAVPLVGELSVSGSSSAVVVANITAALSNYVKNPKVTMNIEEYHTTRVYVLGEVAKPGMYELTKQHNLLDAIGSAGSYTKDAAKRKVFIIRKDNQGGKPLEANLLQLMQKGDMTQNYALRDGDVVYLSKNRRIDIARDILPWVSSLYYMTRIE